MTRPIIRSPIRACTRPSIAPVERENTTVYQVGQAVYANGQIWECVRAGTSAAAEPTIIAPFGAIDVVIDGAFDAALGVNWATTGTWTIAGGLAIAGTNELQQAYTDFVLGESFLTTFDMAGRTVGTCTIQIGGAGSVNYMASTNGGHSGIVTSGAAAGLIRLISVSSFDGTIDNYTLMKVTLDGTEAAGCAWRTIG